MNGICVCFPELPLELFQTPHFRCIWFDGVVFVHVARMFELNEHVIARWCLDDRCQARNTFIHVQIQTCTYVTTGYVFSPIDSPIDAHVCALQRI